MGSRLTIGQEVVEPELGLTWPAVRLDDDLVRRYVAPVSASIDSMGATASPEPDAQPTSADAEGDDVEAFGD